MLEDHSLGLVAATFLTVIIYVIGLVINLCDFARQYLIIPLSVIPSIPGENGTDSSFFLPVSLADWSFHIWGVLYVYQGLWLVYAVTAIFRKTSAGPAYNNPKLLPVQVHLFFSLSLLFQVGWLVSMDEQNLGFALFSILIAIVFSVASLSESYRILLCTKSLLLQQGRTRDLLAVRGLVHNALAAFCTWLMQYATLTFALFLSFGMKSRHVSQTTSSLVQICSNGFILLIYVLSDLTVFDKYSRFVLSPYFSFLLFHTAQISKDWDDIRTATFGLLAFFTAFTFLAVFLKVIVLVWRQLPVQPDGDQEPKVTTSRPLVAEMEEEAYLLEPR